MPTLTGVPSPSDRLASVERLRSMPSMICSQPVVAEGEIAGTDDVWLLRMGGSAENFEAHAMVGSIGGGGLAVGTTMPVPPATQLFPQWGLHHSHSSGRTQVLLAFLTAGEVDEVRVAVQGQADRVMKPIHRYSDPPAAFFLDDFREVSVLTAHAISGSGTILASVNLDGAQLSHLRRVVGPDNHVE